MNGRPLLVPIIVLSMWSTTLVAQQNDWQNPIVKRGYLNSPLVEVTPLSFQGELLLMECWRSQWEWDDGPAPSVKQQSEVWMARLPQGPEHYNKRQYVSRVLENCTLGTAIVWDDRVYVFAVSAEGSTGGKVVYMTWSQDMNNWSAPVKIFESPAQKIFNVAVTRDGHGMVFLWETNGYGQPFTMCYGRVKQPTEPWQDGIIGNARFGMNKYTGGPALYYDDPWYYTLYLEALGGGKYETRITRSRDLIDWQDAPHNRPFITFDPLKNQLPLRPVATTEKNASDAELCFHDGRTLIYFTGGDQIRGGDLQWATYAGLPGSLMASFFEENPRTRVRILSFNILQGGANAANVGFYERDFPGGRLAHVANIIRKTQADIVCVQEDASGESLLRLLGDDWQKSGNLYSRFPLAARPGAGRLNVAVAKLPGARDLVVANDHWWPGDHYGPFVARDLLRDNGAAQDSVEREQTILGDVDNLRIAQDYRRALDILQPYLEANAAIVLAGDFNEPSHLDWTERYSKRGADRWVRNTTGVPLRPKVAWAGSQHLAAAGFRDAYRLVFPDEVLRPGNTWTPVYANGTPGRVNYGDQVIDRIDRVYIAGAGLHVAAAQVVGEDADHADVVIQPWPSDHRAVLVTLDIAD